MAWGEVLVNSGLTEGDFGVGRVIDDVQYRLVVVVVEAEVNWMTFAERNQRQAVTTDIAFDLGRRERALIDTGMCNFSGMRDDARNRVRL